MFIGPMDIHVGIECGNSADDGGEMVVTTNKMLKGGDERPHGMWWVVSFSPPKCEFSPTSQVERATMRGHMEPRRPTNLWRTSRGSSSLAFHLRVR